MKISRGNIPAEENEKIIGFLEGQPSGNNCGNGVYGRHRNRRSSIGYRVTKCRTMRCTDELGTTASGLLRLRVPLDTEDSLKGLRFWIQ